MVFGDAMLHQWSIDHPEEELCGVGWVIENSDMFLHNLPNITKEGLTKMRAVIDRNILKEGEPAYEWLKDYPMTFHGYTPDGKTLWLKWFPEVEIEI